MRQIWYYWALSKEDLRDNLNIPFSSFFDVVKISTLETWFLNIAIFSHGLSTTIFDKISRNKICNAVILLILMHWNSPFGGVCKAEAFHNAWSRPLPMSHGPSVWETKFGASRGSGGCTYSSAFILFQQFCQRLKFSAFVLVNARLVYRSKGYKILHAM